MATYVYDESNEQEEKQEEEKGAWCWSRRDKGLIKASLEWAGLAASQVVVVQANTHTHRVHTHTHTFEHTQFTCSIALAL